MKLQNMVTCIFTDATTQPLKLVAYFQDLETGVEEQATKPAVGCFRCLFLFFDFL